MSGFAPTPEQARAADPRASVWVTANAGTGKTRVLADRVLRLLLDGAHPETILGITFTKAAAVEMTERIERDLAGWAVANEADLTRELTRLEGIGPDHERLSRARRLFAQVLDLPHGLPVMTVHSFCASLLRRFPIEAGIAPHFEQIDDRSSAELMLEARMWLLGEARSRDAKLALALDRLIGFMAEMTLTDLLKTMLSQRDAIAAALDRHAGIDGLEAAVDRYLGAEPEIEVHRLIERACALTYIDVQQLKNAARAMCEDGGKLDQKSGQWILNWLSLTPEERVKSLTEYKSAFLTKDGGPLQRVPTKKIQEAHPQHLQTFIDEQTRLLRLEDQIKIQFSAERAKAIARVAHALIGHYTWLKTRDSSLDFDDLIDKAASLLATREKREWVLYKLDARLDHLLVDEAQDTSPAQWRIVESLIDEFAAGHGAHNKPRTLFVVGDEKQSIYSFQGADLQNFRNVAARIKAKLKPRDEALARSFRTSRAVLELVDNVLALDPVKAGLGGSDLPGHASSRTEDRGEVVLWPLVPPSEPDAASEPWALPGAQRFLPTAEEQLARHLADEVANWLDQREPVPATGELPKPSDVLILISRRGRIQELIIRALKNRNIPVAGADRLNLTDHIAVQDLLALGHSLLLPEDDLTFACLLKSPLLELDEDGLFALAHDRKGRSLFEQLRGRKTVEPYAHAYRRFENWRRLADFVPPYELFCEILNDGGRERMLARLGAEAAEPIEAFLAQALAYEEGHPATLQGFLHWLTLDDQQLKRDSEPARDEVRVMTVHGAKGLEAPFVILADAASAPARRHSPLIVDNADSMVLWRGKRSEQPPVVQALVEADERRIEEERARLLYVALTRAKDRLLIAGWETRQKGSVEKSWYPLIETALLRCDDIETLPAPAWATGGPILKLARGSARPTVKPGRTIDAAAPSLPGWATKIGAEPRPVTIKNPSDNPESEPPAPSPGTSGRPMRNFGIELHRLLHRLAELQVSERAAALTRALAPLEGLLDTEGLARQVRNVLEMPQLAAVFGPGSRAEQPIVGRLGEIVVSGQIDRVAVTENVVYIVDFKSNRRPPNRVEATTMTYLEQMAAYRALLSRIYPGKRVICGLVWTVVPRLDVLPGELLDNALPQA